MAHCSVPFCTSDRRKAASSELSFFNFPKDKHLRRKWIAAIRRDVSNSFQIGRNITFVCSNHFKQCEIKRGLGGHKKRLVPGAVPCIFTWNSATKSRPTNKVQDRRYEDGSQRYLDLLAALSEASHLTQIDDVSTCVVDLPHIRTIYKETVECLLHAGHYEDCVIVCDKALESIRLTLNPSATSFGADNISSLLGPDDSEDLSQTISTNSRKRPRSSSCDLSLANQNEDDWQDVQHHMTLTLCKADALIALNDHDNASDSLHRAIEALLECSGRWSEVSEADIPTTSEPVPKRRRTVNDEEVLIKTETSSCPGWKSLLVQACCKFSSLLTDQGKSSDALHYSRIAVQTLPGDTRAWYTCCTALHQSGREEESCRAWLHHRGVGQLSDDSHLQRELHKKQSQLRKLLTESEDTALESGDLGSRAALEMDVKSIQQMLQQEHPRLRM